MLEKNRPGLEAPEILASPQPRNDRQDPTYCWADRRLFVPLAAVFEPLRSFPADSGAGWLVFVYMASSQEGDLRLSGPPPGRAAVVKLEPTTKRFPQISGRIRYPLCLRGAQGQDEGQEDKQETRPPVSFTADRFSHQDQLLPPHMFIPFDDF
ncbi:hypothetical protein PoB_004854600 [Plakobranchus ocellatus]|uniref:Uncharacterized protein n=1 Tax=Plakobranchus ocellatus TaxID=259542 RepID=A0AAV4BNJ5_9GAST|nr:hypothetical protein PoB_004854600 [Plakobranchus ocellatus]